MLTGPTMARSCVLRSQRDQGHFLEILYCAMAATTSALDRHLQFWPIETNRYGNWTTISFLNSTTLRVWPMATEEDSFLCSSRDVGLVGLVGRYFPAAGTGVTMTSSYKLPTGLLCERCVLQWRYVAGNNWGTCANGTGHNGCGPQVQNNSTKKNTKQSRRRNGPIVLGKKFFFGYF